MTEITETRCTCGSCGNVWHYGKADKLQAQGAAMQNLGKSMMCCSGCGPAAFLPDQDVPDLNKCPQCGSRAVSKTEVTHQVPDPNDLDSRD